MCHTQKENRKEQQGRSSLVPVGRKKQVFRSRAGRERRNPLELPGALSSRSADLCRLQRQGPSLLWNPQQTFRQICDCQTSYVIALHPVTAERLLNGGGFQPGFEEKHRTAVCCVKLPRELWLLKASAQELPSTLQKMEGHQVFITVASAGKRRSNGPLLRSL